ncbi:MAG: DUF1549 and DUF1553 domain-containing protein [Planctomycetales bacterium]
MLRRLTIVSLLALFGAASLAQARPPYRKALADHFGPFLANDLNDCRTCHLPASEETRAEGKPHNLFGVRLKELKDSLTEAGKPADIVSRIEEIADEDSDGDGVANLLELLSGRNPGEPGVALAADELRRTRHSLREFRARKDYPWRPFEVVERPPVPQVGNAAWVRNPIDAFIAAEHEKHTLKPRPEAPRSILVRRLYLDLIGLPPTREELTAALGDTSPGWYESLVDRLLDSPRHGERWGRHWMDVWRYSDWYGYQQEVRSSQPHVWRWRDWIVESLNEDKGYDRMIVEMLAGDEVAPDDPDVLRATGYLVRNYNRHYRDKGLQDTVDHTFQGFLGLTIGCARCHDHMYDPISQEEYYQVRAFFEPHQVRIDHVPGEIDLAKDGLARAFDGAPEAPTYLFIRGDTAEPDKTASIPPGVPRALGGRLPEITPVSLPASAFAPEKRDFVVAGLLAQSERGREAAREKREKAAKETEIAVADVEIELADARHEALAAVLRAEALDDAQRKDSDEWKAAAIEAAGAQRKQALIEARKNLLVAHQAHEAAAEKAREPLAKRVTALEKALADAEAKAEEEATTEYKPRAVTSYPKESSGRRLALARWIADRENPLTARVAVNHMWHRHFGQALVPRIFDFGGNAAPPTHPALLDWLGAEFVEQGWSIKAVHRLIVTSATYRQASTTDPENAAIDRDNVYYWRMPSKRMEAEVVRDSVLHLAGRLDLAMGGPDIDHRQGLIVPRRSLYFRHAQEKQMEFLKLFDAASVIECYQRNSSVIPQQALALSNSDFAIKQSRLLARALDEHIGSESPAFVAAAFEQVLARPPTEEEAAVCLAFLAEQSQLYRPPAKPTAAVDEKLPASDPQLRARENLVRILFNHHDFVTIR